MVLPSYYLQQLDSKRKRSADLRGGLAQGMQGAVGGADALARVLSAIEGKKLDAEQKAHGREIEAKNQARADERFAWDREDRTRRLEDEDVYRTTAAESRLDVMKRALGDNAASLAADDAEEAAEGEARAGTMADAFAGVQADVDDEAAEDAARQTTMTSALDKVMASLEEPEGAPMMTAQQRLAEERARKAKADADLAERKLKGGGGARPDPMRDAKRRKAEADAKIAEAKAAGLDAPNTKGADALRREMNADPQVKNFREVQIAHEKMKAAAANPSPAGDLTLVFSFMKMQDPNSTVRESEFAAAAKAGDFGDQVQAAVSRVASGQLLTPDQRKDFLSQAENFYAAQKNASDAAMARYSDIASRRGVDVADVTGTDDRQARFLRRVQDLKGQGLSKEQAREILRQENLLP